MKKNIFLILIGLFGSTAHAESIAIKAGHLLDPVSGKLHKQQILLIENEKIKSIGKDIKIPSNAQVIDLSQATVLPGLIDAHTHLCWEYNIPRSSNPLSIIRTPTAYRALQGARNARDMLLSGFTSVRDLGNAGMYADAALKQAIESNLLPGPNIMIAGRLITTFGGQKRVIPERPNMYGEEYFFADTRDELKKAIRENIHYGADVIKIIVSDQRYAYSLSDIKYIVSEAAASGLDVAAHANDDIDIKNAILAGARTIEHGSRISEETLKLMKKHGTYFVTTSFPEKVMMSMRSRRNTNNSKSSNRFNKYYQRNIEKLKSAYKHKVKVAFGADVVSAVPDMNRGEATLEFIESFKDAGASPLQIIQAMTINAAGALNQQDFIGRLSEGFQADIIAVENNPLEDIDQLRQVMFVMKSGKIYKE